MDKIIVTAGGLAVIVGMYWFFFGKKSGEAGSGFAREETKSTWNIHVEGGYKPNTITINQGKPATLTFIRTDSNRCLEEIIFPDYKIKEYLPLNIPITITLPPKKKGVSGFYCGMNMFHGRIRIV
ncbi:MAG: hypothetical protein UV63_C0060G0001 [Microgenomates group bacterium GW2011_GWC1_43_11]|nr:MAG: hypothetical protein UV63_C0060G0001 [Microgenomates group bacterium GW2011_GWC1_43_11]HCM81849.1 copper-binding protein [Patescibacteria group bacterium]